MPAFISEAKPAEQKMQQVWDLVNFIQAVPYPWMLPEEVRRQVYGSDKAGETAHTALTHRD
jgi:hypothetical protein